MSESVGWTHRRSRRWRAALIGLLALLLAATVAACGSSSSGSSGKGGSGQPDKVTFAALLPLTGPNAGYGKFEVNGVKMAADEINAAGGIGGKTKIELAIEDSQASPEQTVTAFNRAYSEHKMPVAISVGSSSILALVPLSKQRDVLLLNGGSQGDELAGASDMLFSTIHLIRNEVAVLAPYLVKNVGLKRGAVLYIDDDLGRAGLKDFKQDFTAAGGQVVATASHEPGATDMRSQLARLRNANPDVLFLASYGDDAHVAVNQTRQLGWDVRLAGPSLVALPDIIADKDAEGLIHTPIVFRPQKQFADEYQQKFNEAPGHPYVGTYYDAVKVAAQAYQYAQEHGYGTDGKGIAKAISEIKTFPTSFGGDITFDDQGVAKRPIAIAIDKGGKSVVVKRG
ncbi:MAG: ABC transporter substrate-binding protein [Thermoleophilaceae bacterium]|nr:ABC transporter substrate-binding protein [Thermoleophilaceae bacterium]